MDNPTPHRCNPSWACYEDAYQEAYGTAIDHCVERDGQFWVGNGEYGSRVNYCPYCGAKAPSQVGEE
jgi:hypothetical protein